MNPELAALENEAHRCQRCPLFADAKNLVFGVGDPNSDLMFIGEAPGQQEDLQGEPFVGRSGRLLDQLVLEEMGLTRDQFYITNVVKHRPPGNRDPKPDEISACRVYLDGQLKAMQPKVVVTLGNFASRYMLDTVEGVTKLRGKIYPYREGFLIPTYHPSALLRTGGTLVAKMRADLVRAKQVMTGQGSMS